MMQTMENMGRDEAVFRGKELMRRIAHARSESTEYDVMLGELEDILYEHKFTLMTFGECIHADKMHHHHSTVP